MSAEPPFKGTIEVHLWAWGLRDARAILDQLVNEINEKATDLNGGLSVHHRIIGVKVEDKGPW